MAAYAVTKSLWANGPNRILRQPRAGLSNPLSRDTNGAGDFSMEFLPMTNPKAMTITHGGKRPGAGRPAPDGAKVGTSVYVTPEVKQYLDTRENRSVAVEDAIRQSKQFKQWKAANNAH